MDTRASRPRSQTNPYLGSPLGLRERAERARQRDRDLAPSYLFAKKKHGKFLGVFPVCLNTHALGILSVTGSPITQLRRHAQPCTRKHPACGGGGAQRTHDTYLLLARCLAPVCTTQPAATRNDQGKRQDPDHGRFSGGLNTVLLGSTVTAALLFFGG